MLRHSDTLGTKNKFHPLRNKISIRFLRKEILGSNAHMRNEMEGNLKRILMVGSTHSNESLMRNLEKLVPHNSAHIELFDSTENCVEHLLNTRNQTASTRSETTHNFESYQSKLHSIDREKLFATILIQDTDSDNDLKEKLPFHETINHNQLLWYSFQEFLFQNEINSVVFLTMPEGLSELVLYHAAKAQNIDVLILCQSPVSDHYFSFRSIQDCGNYDQKAEIKTDIWYSNNGISSSLIDQHSRVNCQGSNSSEILKICWFLLKVRSLKLLNPAYILRRAKHLHDAPDDIDLWKDQFAKFFYCSSVAYFEFLTSDHSSQFNLSEKFVYFPLQSPTELHSEIPINRFGDQLLALERLASMLPRDYKIVVKSDQFRNSDYLTAMFFHRIKRIQNVVRLPSCFGVEQLIDHSKFVATVNSNDGWEALTREKKVLVFGHPWYRNLPGAHQYHDRFVHSEITESEFNNLEFQDQVNCLFDQSHTGQLTTTSENASSIASTILDLVFNRTNVTFQSPST